MTISLSFDNWGDTLLKQLLPLWKDANLCDTKIECGGKNIIQAHSVILSAASPKLYAYCTAAQGVNYTIVTPDVPVFVWRNVLAFIYEGVCEFAEDELIPTFNFASLIEVHKLTALLDNQVRLYRANQATEIAHAAPLQSSTALKRTSSPTRTKPIKSRRVAPGKNATTDGKTVVSKGKVEDRTPKSPEATKSTIQVQAVDATTVTTTRHECPNCLQSFNRKASLEKHISECSQFQDKTVVSYKSFYTKLGDNIKADGAKFKCDLCGKEYSAYQGLYSHLKSNHGDKVHAVAATEHDFRPSPTTSTKSNKSQLLNKRESVCNICNKQFSSYSAMLSHKNSSHKSSTTRRPSANSAQPGNKS